MPITTAEDARLMLQWAQREITTRAAQGAGWLQSVQGILERMKTEGFKDELLSMVENQLKQAAERAGDILQIVRDLVADGVIDDAGAKELLTFRLIIINGITTLSTKIKNAASKRDMSVLGEMIRDVIAIVSDFANVSGITSTLKSVWKGVVEPIIKGTEEAAKGVGALLGWLPWIAAGVGAVIVLPYILRSVGVIRSNPPRRRRRESGTALLPMLVVGGGAVAAIVALMGRSKTIPTVPAAPVILYRPLGALMTDLGSKGLIAALTAARIPYMVDRLADGTYKFMVPQGDELKAMAMFETARLAERAITV